MARHVTTRDFLGILVVALALVLAALTLVFVISQRDLPMQNMQRLEQDIERNGREASDDCRKSPGCEPGTKDMTLESETTPARR